MLSLEGKFNSLAYLKNEIVKEYFVYFDYITFSHDMFSIFFLQQLLLLLLYNID